MVSRIVLSAVFSAILLLPALLVVGTVGSYPFTYVGTEEFSSIEKFQQFQTDVVGEAAEVGASVGSFDLSIQSPPTVKYTIYTPSPPFRYGEPLMSFRVTYVLQALVTLPLLATIVFANLNIWKRRS